MNNNTIHNLEDPDPRGANQATNKKHVDTLLATKLDREINIDMKGHLISNLALPSKNKDAAWVEYVNYRINTEAAKYVKVDGSSAMTSDFDLNDKKNN